MAYLNHNLPPFSAYIRNDNLFWPSPSPWGTNLGSNELKLVEHFATLLVWNKSENPSINQLTCEEIAGLAKQTTMDHFFDQILEKLPANCNLLLPEGHCNWFSERKLLNIFRAHHFNDAKPSQKMDVCCHSILLSPDYKKSLEQVWGNLKNSMKLIIPSGGDFAIGAGVSCEKIEEGSAPRLRQSIKCRIGDKVININ